MLLLVRSSAAALSLIARPEKGQGSRAMTSVRSSGDCQGAVDSLTAPPSRRGFCTLRPVSEPASAESPRKPVIDGGLSEYRIQCRKCNTRTLAEPVTRTLSDHADNPFEDYWYIVVSCKMCYSVHLVRYPKSGFYDSSKGVVLWPRPDNEAHAAIPEALRLEHLEARKCYRNGAFTATVVMVRRTLEGVCVEHGIRDTPLVKALKRMQDTGLIEGRLVEWAQALRVLGNEAAHFTGTRVALEDAQDALALAEAILNYLYVFTEQFNEFIKRRSPASSQAQGNQKG